MLESLFSMLYDTVSSSSWTLQKHAGELYLEYDVTDPTLDPCECVSVLFEKTNRGSTHKVPGFTRDEFLSLYPSWERVVPDGVNLSFLEWNTLSLFSSNKLSKVYAAYVDENGFFADDTYGHDWWAFPITDPDAQVGCREGCRETPPTVAVTYTSESSNYLPERVREQLPTGKRIHTVRFSEDYSYVAYEYTVLHSREPNPRRVPEVDPDLLSTILQDFQLLVPHGILHTLVKVSVTHDVKKVYVPIPPSVFRTNYT